MDAKGKKEKEVPLSKFLLMEAVVVSALTTCLKHPGSLISQPGAGVVLFPGTHGRVGTCGHSAI